MEHSGSVTGQKAPPASDSAVRAVARAIIVLKALNSRPESTLHDLHCETGLPKPSIVRLLRTLEAKGLAAQSPSYGKYELRAGIKSLSSGFHHEPLIIETAEKIMIDFTRREGWPLMLAFFDVDALVVRACTIAHTSLWLERSSLNKRLSLVGHPMGRAYLAHSTPREQEILLEILRRSPNPEDALAQDDEAMTRMIDQIRQHGYTMCRPTADHRSWVIAVPVRAHGRTLACLGLTWMSAAMSHQQAIRQCVPRAFEIADEISRKLERPPTCREGSSEPGLTRQNGR